MIDAGCPHNNGRSNNRLFHRLFHRLLRFFAFDFWLKTSGGETGRQPLTTLVESRLVGARGACAGESELFGETTSMTTIAIDAPQSARMTSEQRLVIFASSLGTVF